MANELAFSYALILKSEKQEDGTLKVFGKATDDSLDIDKQICDEGWLKTAMPDWFESGGNIREQHSNIAAGVATDYESKADGHYITALVVDPVSVKKVETGVLKGFSIGIRSPRIIRDEKAAGGRIVDGQIVEVSLVDRPANPNAKLMLAKALESGELVAVEQLNIPSPADLFKAAEETEEEKAKRLEEEATAAEALAEDKPAAEATEEEAEKETAPEEEAAPAEDMPAEEAKEDDAAPEMDKNYKALMECGVMLDKFDAEVFGQARQALARLIEIEQGEAEEGSDETSSLADLLSAVDALLSWYAGEQEEGEVPAEDLPVDEATEKAIIAKAVASATAAVSEEVAKLRSAFEAEAAKATKLEADLVIAKNAAVGGGPKRTTLTKATSADKNVILQQVAELRLKAARTNDRELAVGYKEWADELEKNA